MGLWKNRNIDFIAHSLLQTVGIVAGWQKQWNCRSHQYKNWESDSS